MSGHADNGKKNFLKYCAHCHTIDKGGKSTVGPNLHGVVGRKSGAYAGFHFTNIYKSKGITWNDSTLSEYLENPSKFMPGTKKNFSGLKSAEERADVIAYLKTKK